jgi:hypothetical protein
VLVPFLTIICRERDVTAPVRVPAPRVFAADGASSATADHDGATRHRFTAAGGALLRGSLFVSGPALSHSRTRSPAASLAQNQRCA